MNTKKAVSYTIPDKDLQWETFRCGGKGGQNVNKRDTGARVVHLPSRARGESREERSQLQNKKTALKRLTENKIFRNWCGLQLQAIEEGFKGLEEKVDAIMNSEEILVERWDEETKKWVKA